jgi:hypothetical protein
MDTQSPQPGLSGSASCRLAGASLNTSIVGTQHERRHQLVHWESADAATKHMTQDAHFIIVRKTGSSTNNKQHAVGCEYLHTMVNSRQLTVQQTAGVH